MTNEEIALQAIKIDGVLSVDIETNEITLTSVEHIMDVTDLFRIGQNGGWTLRYTKITKDIEKVGSVIRRKTEDMVFRGA